MKKVLAKDSAREHEQKVSRSDGVQRPGNVTLNVLPLGCSLSHAA